MFVRLGDLDLLDSPRHTDILGLPVCYPACDRHVQLSPYPAITCLMVAHAPGRGIDGWVINAVLAAIVLR